MLLPFEQPLTYYGALSTAMGACLFLFVMTERKVEKLRRTSERDLAAGEKQMGLLGAQMASLETRLGEWAVRTTEVEETVASLSAVRRKQIGDSNIDANQRTAVFRMARRGDSPERIAAELRVPRNEVDLLLKVQRAVVRAF